MGYLDSHSTYYSFNAKGENARVEKEKKKGVEGNDIPQLPVPYPATIGLFLDIH